MKLSLRYSAILFFIFLFSACLKKEQASCEDGIKNQNEIFTDCGGPCAKCPSCFDGIRNQEETDIDCGGPCAPCKTNSTGDHKILYSEYGTYGYNLLYDDTVQIIKGTPAGSAASVFYTLRSHVPEGVRLKVVMTRRTSSGMWYYMPSGTNWLVTPGNLLNASNSHRQEFSTIGKVTTDIQLFFSDEGAVTLDIYEGNDSLPARSKFLVWKP